MALLKGFSLKVIFTSNLPADLSMSAGFFYDLNFLLGIVGCILTNQKSKCKNIHDQLTS